VVLVSAAEDVVAGEGTDDAVRRHVDEVWNHTTWPLVCGPRDTVHVDDRPAVLPGDVVDQVVD
jgi:hypothetical protein